MLTVCRLFSRHQEAADEGRTESAEEPLRTVSMNVIFCKREISFLLMRNSA
jgi:hypothetical protein